MNHAETPSALADALRRNRSGVIAIDGVAGSGKSTLAAELSAVLGVSALSLDDFVNRGLEHYFSNLDLPAIAGAISANRPCIVEGVCMLQVMEALALVPDALVYVKRMARWGWADEDELLANEPLDEHLNRLRAQASAFSGQAIESLGLAEEVIRYHAHYKPHERADHVFLRRAA